MSTESTPELGSPRQSTPVPEVIDPHALRARPPVLIDEPELVIISRLCSRTIRKLVKSGVIPRIKIGRRVLFRWPQVEAALAKLETKASASAMPRT